MMVPENMIVHRCKIPDCPSPIILIETEPLDTPDSILSVEEELATKTANHNRRLHRQW